MEAFAVHFWRTTKPRNVPKTKRPKMACLELDSRLGGCGRHLMRVSSPYRKVFAPIGCGGWKSGFAG